MSVFNFKLKDLITIKNDFQELDLESSLVTIHYNAIPNSYTLIHNVYSDKFWDYIKNKFVIKPENVNIKTDLS